MLQATNKVEPGPMRLTGNEQSGTRAHASQGPYNDIRNYSGFNRSEHISWS